MIERWELAKETGCDYVELPGHLIYNKSEEIETDLKIGCFPRKKDIENFYTTSDLPDDLRYVLHTDPSIGKYNRYGLRKYTEIKWFNSEWRKRYCHLIIEIADYLGRAPSIIEIHPGDTQNLFEDVVSFCIEVRETFSENYGDVSVLLENRTEQFIATGRELRDYWQYITDSHRDIREKLGLVLDIQQLFTKTKTRFKEEFSIIPDESLKGFHIHHKHRWPSIRDPIPWSLVFSRIRELNQKIIINPEIHQKKRVQQSIDFCNRMLNL
ncbi:MAG: TIM barrel protein [Candidatus Bathyarchaeota archaeon]|nr:TIM barrel protein [Candidatus Bathyarchaeota archaeon]